MLINARPQHTLCRLHEHKCLPARGGGLIKDIHISSTGMCEHFTEAFPSFCNDINYGHNNSNKILHAHLPRPIYRRNRDIDTIVDLGGREGSGHHHLRCLLLDPISYLPSDLLRNKINLTINYILKKSLDT